MRIFEILILPGFLGTKREACGQGCVGMFHGSWLVVRGFGNSLDDGQVALHGNYFFCPREARLWEPRILIR
jgi:hypothetical protein